MEVLAWVSVDSQKRHCCSKVALAALEEEEEEEEEEWSSGLTSNWAR